MLVSEWMTREVISIPPTEKLSTAAQWMAKRRVRQLPITEHDRLVGLLTKSDLLRACPPHLNPFSLAATNATELAQPVRQVMTTQVVTVAPDEPLEGAARLIIERRMNALPVISPIQNLQGILTSSDISRALLAALGAGSPGVRITFEVHPNEDVFSFISGLASQHGARVVNVTAFVHQGRYQAVVRLDQEKPAMVEALWQSGHRVSSVARFR
jgi:acetoin utilization protein AcuB